MSLTDSRFFLFLLLTLILYYVFVKMQKYVLLVASLYFYIMLSSFDRYKLIVMMICILLLTYVGGYVIQRLKGWKRKIVLIISVGGLVSILVITKYAYNVLSLIGIIIHCPMKFSILKFANIVGISYFILSAISYLADVYMHIIPADGNIATVSLFVFYFPQVISGPVTRFGQMREQFSVQHRVNYDVMTYGARRMIWGYLKKLVISERFAVIVSAVYANYNSYSGIGIVAATICYGVQIYTDFSGCMDIVMGASELFGIRLPENFRAPYMSSTFQEFYQRWHITLGGWFKDYVMYPIQKSRMFQSAGKLGKSIFGKKRGKMVPLYLALLVLWVGIGIWHGGNALYFMVSTVIPFTLLVMSDLLKPTFKRLNELLKINTEAESWRWFQRCRTYLIVCTIFLFISAGGVKRGISIIYWSIIHPFGFTTLNESFEKFGLTVIDTVIILLGTFFVIMSDIITDKGSDIFNAMNRQNLFIRELIIMVELFIIAVYINFQIFGTNSVPKHINLPQPQAWVQVFFASCHLCCIYRA